MSVKGVGTFLEHARFYRQFIMDFSKITKPLCNLLVKEVTFDFSDKCLLAFNTLNEKIILAPIIIAPNWNLLFELKCNASDYVVGPYWDSVRTKYSM